MEKLAEGWARGMARLAGGSVRKKVKGPWTQARPTPAAVKTTGAGKATGLGWAGLVVVKVTALVWLRETGWARETEAGWRLP